VLVANPFYQDGPAPQFKDFEDFRGNGGFQKVGPWMAKNTHER
jgi:carboxymethylenebutenolidase